MRPSGVLHPRSRLLRPGPGDEISRCPSRAKSSPFTRTSNPTGWPTSRAGTPNMSAMTRPGFSAPGSSPPKAAPPASATNSSARSAIPTNRKNDSRAVAQTVILRVPSPQQDSRQRLAPLIGRRILGRPSLRQPAHRKRFKLWFGSMIRSTAARKINPSIPAQTSSATRSPTANRLESALAKKTGEGYPFSTFNCCLAARPA
jgi:hypothetical protein